MPKALKVALIAVFCLGVTKAGFAEKLKVGCVDVIKVFNNYNRTRDQEAGLTKKAADYKQKHTAMIEEIKKLRDKIALLSDKAKEKKQQELENKSDALKAFETKNLREIQRERDTTRREILQEIEKYITTYARDNGYDLIIYRNVLVFNRPNMDLTDEVLNGLNKKYKAGK
jgi:outer membrane protein